MTVSSCVKHCTVLWISYESTDSCRNHSLSTHLGARTSTMSCYNCRGGSRNSWRGVQEFSNRQAKKDPRGFNPPYPPPPRSATELIKKLYGCAELSRTFFTRCRWPSFWRYKCTLVFLCIMYNYPDPWERVATVDSCSHQHCICAWQMLRECKKVRFIQHVCIIAHHLYWWITGVKLEQFLVPICAGSNAKHTKPMSLSQRVRLPCVVGQCNYYVADDAFTGVTRDMNIKVLYELLYKIAK